MITILIDILKKNRKKLIEMSNTTNTNIQANTKKQKYQRILERKQATHPEQLCRGFPTEFRDFFVHCLSLGFEDRPDYR